MIPQTIFKHAYTHRKTCRHSGGRKKPNFIKFYTSIKIPTHCLWNVPLGHFLSKKLYSQSLTEGKGSHYGYGQIYSPKKYYGLYMLVLDRKDFHQSFPWILWLLRNICNHILYFTLSATPLPLAWVMGTLRIFLKVWKTQLDVLTLTISEVGKA